MLRQQVPDNDSVARSARPSPSIETDTAESSFQTRWRKTVLSESEQSRIYRDWISRFIPHFSCRAHIDILISLVDAGKPHNFVCSGCRLPENLIGCETCCRAYHRQCLSANLVSEFFHCPSCKQKTWNRAPPLPPPSLASTVSPDATPGNSFQRTEPLVKETPSIQGSPMTGYNTPECAESTAPPGKGDDFEAEYPDDLPPVFEMYSQVLAHLYQPDANRGASVLQPEFLHQLNLMVREVESRRSLLQRMTTLREEFSRVQTENMQLRADLNAHLPRARDFTSTPNLSRFPRPSADTVGKSWDTIVMDFI